MSQYGLGVFTILLAIVLSILALVWFITKDAFKKFISQFTIAFVGIIYIVSIMVVEYNIGETYALVLLLTGMLITYDSVYESIFKVKEDKNEKLNRVY